MSERPNTVFDDRERVEQIILFERVHLYNAGRPCGAATLRRHLIEQEYLHPAPTVSKIGCVLREYGMTPSARSSLKTATVKQTSAEDPSSRYFGGPDGR